MFDPAAATARGRDTQERVAVDLGVVHHELDPELEEGTPRPFVPVDPAVDAVSASATTPAILSQVTATSASAKRSVVYQGLILFVKALPVALLVVAARYVFHKVFGFSDIMSFSDAAAVLTGAALIIGFMLAGVIADFKEAEKIPANMGGALLMLDQLAASGLALQDKDSGWARARLAAVANRIDDWFFGRVPDDSLNAIQNEVFCLIVDVEKQGCSAPYVTQLLNRANELVGSLQRVMVIRNSSFIKAGYALMTILVSVVLVLLVIVDFPSEFAQWLVCGALALVYTDLLLLVRDLDNPFGYRAHGGRGSGADVDPAAFTNAVRILNSTGG